MDDKEVEILRTKGLRLCISLFRLSAWSSRMNCDNALMICDMLELRHATQK